MSKIDCLTMPHRKSYTITIRTFMVWEIKFM